MPLDHDILDALNRYMKKVLKQPDPYAAVEDLQLKVSLLFGGQIRYSSVDTVPPFNYRVQYSQDLENWSSPVTVQPSSGGILQVDVDPSQNESTFVRVLSPVNFNPVSN
jgi:hypothetical protein